MKLETPLNFTTVDPMQTVYLGEYPEVLLVVETVHLAKVLQRGKHPNHGWATIGKLLIELLHNDLSKLVNLDGFQLIGDGP